MIPCMLREHCRASERPGATSPRLTRGQVLSEHRLRFVAHAGLVQIQNAKDSTCYLHSSSGVLVSAAAKLQHGNLAVFESKTQHLVERLETYITVCSTFMPCASAMSRCAWQRHQRVLLLLQGCLREG